MRAPWDARTLPLVWPSGTRFGSRNLCRRGCCCRSLCQRRLLLFAKQAFVASFPKCIQQEAGGKRQQDQRHEESVNGCRGRRDGNHAADENPDYAYDGEQTQNQTKRENQGTQVTSSCLFRSAANQTGCFHSKTCGRCGG